MSGSEPLWVPIVIACITTSTTIISEYLGSRDPNNPNLCRSIINATAVGYQYVRNKISSTPAKPKDVELDTITSNINIRTRPAFVPANPNILSS